MDSHALMNRVDTKYVFGVVQLPELLESTAHAYRVLSVEELRLCPYRSLYFDTPDHECYRHHHSGHFSRRKYRIRQYQSTGACFLEVKTKNNKRRTDKKRIPIEDFEQSLSTSSRKFFKSVTGSVPDLGPQLWITFSRITIVNRHLPERATIDLNLTFNYGDVETGFPGLVIAEVKQERDNRHTPIREQLRQLLIRPMRVSKYCVGTVLMKPHLKYNRFKPKLLKIRKVA